MSAIVQLSSVDRWKPMGCFLKQHPQFQENQLRWLARNRDRNGFDKAFRKVGRRLYIHDELFAEAIFGLGNGS